MGKRRLPPSLRVHRRANTACPSFLPVSLFTIAVNECKFEVRRSSLQTPIHPILRLFLLPLRWAGEYKTLPIASTTRFPSLSSTSLPFSLCFLFSFPFIPSSALFFLLFLVFPNKQTHASPSISRSTLS